MPGQRSGWGRCGSRARVPCPGRANGWRWIPQRFRARRHLTGYLMDCLVGHPMAWRMTCRQMCRPASGMSRRRAQMLPNGRYRQPGRATKALCLRTGQFPNGPCLHPHQYQIPCLDLRLRPMMSSIGSGRRCPAPCPVRHPGKRATSLAGSLIPAIPPGTKTRRWPAGMQSPGRTTAAPSYRYWSGTTSRRRPPADGPPGHHRSRLPGETTILRLPHLQECRTPMPPGR